MKAKLACLAGPALGILAILLWGGEPPDWLLRLELLIFCLAALAFGFTLYSPVAPAWIFSRPVKGIVCIYLGVGAMFVPSQFIVSAMFLGMGTRFLMSEFKPLTVSVKPATGIARTPGDIVRRESGSIAPRD